MPTTNAAMNSSVTTTISKISFVLGFTTGTDGAPLLRGRQRPRLHQDRRIVHDQVFRDEYLSGEGDERRPLDNDDDIAALGLFRVWLRILSDDGVWIGGPLVLRHGTEREASRLNRGLCLTFPPAQDVRHADH